MKEERYILPDDKTDAAFAAEAEYERTGKNTNWDDFIEELKEERLWLI
nr:hypothetical protein [uncultured Prevotella sp.]